jgi:hypothetical protein
MHQPLATSDEQGNEVIEMSTMNETHLPTRSWLLDSESEEEDGDVERQPRLSGRSMRLKSMKNTVRYKYPCCRLFFCCTRSLVKLNLLLAIFILTFSIFGMEYRTDHCWTGKDELLLLTRFDQENVGANGKFGVWPLKNAHSHNDYVQTLPLREALLAGFCSVEGDVYLLATTLYLGHAVASKLTLEDLYLRPLIDAVKQNDGTVYKRALKLGTCLQFTVLVDIKSVETIETWLTLEAMLERLDTKLPDGRPIFETFDAQNNVLLPDDVTIPSPIKVVITGLGGSVNEIAAKMAQMSSRKCSIDLNAPTESSQAIAVASWISQKWSFAWPDPNKQSLEVTKKAIQARVRYANKNKLLVRYWDTPEDADLWQFLLEQGVHLINTDSIFTLHSFLVGKSTGGEEP